MHSGLTPSKTKPSRESWWTDRSIEWFERASSYASYHDSLVDVIEPYLERPWAILEAGCGLGYEAQILNGRGYSVRAFDSDRKVIERARLRSGLDIFRVERIEDLHDAADVLLCVNFGRIEDKAGLERLMRHAGKRIIYVISRHAGHDACTRPDRSGRLERVLNRVNVRFERKDFKIRFDQPLSSLDEARSFIGWTYLNDDVERYMEFVEPSDGEYQYIFRNEKSMALFAIDV